MRCEAEGGLVMKLEIENLTFSYGDGPRIIDGLSLSYESPDVLCILGSNGTGKSTLLQCVIGDFRPSSGQVLVNGRDVPDVFGARSRTAYRLHSANARAVV